MKKLKEDKMTKPFKPSDYLTKAEFKKLNELILTPLEGMLFTKADLMFITRMSDKIWNARFNKRMSDTLRKVSTKKEK